MATIEGLYLADDRDNLIFEYQTSSGSPSLSRILTTLKGIGYQHLHNDSIVEISSTHTVYKVKSGRVLLYALASTGLESSLNLKSLHETEIDSDIEELKSDNDDEDEDDKNDSTTNSNIIINPNLIFVFLNRIYDILIDYFGAPLNSLKIEANYDIMCNLMQELIEGGFPFITEPNSLKELVPFQSSLGSKILSTTNSIARNYSNPTINGFQSSLSSSSLSSSSSSSNITNGDSKIPWRKSNVKYTNNELFVDLKEEINVVFTHQRSKRSNLKKLVPTVAVLRGQIDFTSHLSGIPDIQLELNLNGHYLGVPSFHRSIKIDRWLNNHILSFVPPDGKSTLVDYVIDLDQYPTSKIQKNLGLVNVNYKESLGLKKNEFELILNLNLYKNVSKIENLKIIISTESDQTVKILRLSHGDFQTKSNGKSEWVFDSQTQLGINPILKGIIETDTSDQNDNSGESNELKVSYPKSISLSYSNKGSLPSGIRVESLKILKGIDVKPYKGVKYITTVGDFIIR